jgi:hypothetical protein
MKLRKKKHRFKKFDKIKKSKKKIDDEIAKQKIN